MRTLVLASGLRTRIEEAGKLAFPNECCGILIGRDPQAEPGRRIVDQLIPGSNVFDAGEQYHRFLIEPMDQLKAEKVAAAEGKLVLGYYHSHPDHPARPSEYDREHAWSFYSYVIVSIMAGHAAALTSWVLNEQSQFDEQQVIPA